LAIGLPRRLNMKATWHVSVSMLQDFRFAIRLLLKDRTFTITALLTLAICIGANAAMLSVVRSVILKPLPFPDADRIVLLYNSYPNAGVQRVGAGVPDYFDRQTAVPALDQTALFRDEGMVLGDEGGAERLTSLRGTPSFFRMLAPRVAEGRIFTDAEGEPGKDRVVLLSYGFWQRKYAGQAVVNQTMRLNGNAHTVVGVLPRDFTFLQNDIDVFVPASFRPQDKADSNRHSNNWQMIGHIKAGATLDLVRQQVDVLNAKNEERFPEFRKVLRDAGFRTVAVLLQDDVVRDVKASLYLLWGGVFFVLVIGCVNLANLVIVRAGGRAREMATRHAIGGDLSRLARQLMTETTVLSVAGGVLGMLMGWWALRSVTALSLDQLPRGYEISLDAFSLAAVAGLTLLVGIILGLAPVFRLRRMNLTVDLREETRGGTASRRANQIRNSMATVQVAIALVVLVGAGLLFASFRAFMSSDFGFQPGNVGTITLTMPGTSYGEPEKRVGFQQRALAALRALPGVEAAGGTTLVPFGGSISNSVILAEGHVMKPGESLLAPSNGTVTTGYFEAMGVRLQSGRFFDTRDVFTATKVVVIDDRLARLFWPGQEAVGRRLYRPTDNKDLTRISPQTQFLTVVGVIKEMALIDPRGDVKPVGVVYFPYEQNAGNTLTLAVKTHTPADVTNSVRAALARLDPQVPVYRPRPMQEWIDRALVGRRAPMLIALAFAAVALFLSSIGVYGVLAYGVSQRRRELGVRLALGGTGRTIFRLVLATGLKIVGVGLAVGLVGSYLVGEVMRSQLFNIAPTNPLVLLVVVATLSIVATLASIVPAWRASRIDPIVVLSR
jgi:predicted permease